MDRRDAECNGGNSTAQEYAGTAGAGAKRRAIFIFMRAFMLVRFPALLAFCTFVAIALIAAGLQGQQDKIKGKCYIECFFQRSKFMK